MVLRILLKAAFAAFCIQLFTGVPTGVFAAEISTVKASGQAALSGQSLQKVRRIALEDALYLAAISAGTEISGTTISANGILVRDVVSLNTNAQLVDFTVLKEDKTETHYKVSVEAYFAQKSRSHCQNPRPPSILLLKPDNYVSSNVDVRYRRIAEHISTQIQKLIAQLYSGPVHDYSTLSLEDYKKSISHNRLFSYSSLQSNQPTSKSADFIVGSEVRVRRFGNDLNADVTLNVIKGPDHSIHSEFKRRLTAELPVKSPFKLINVLTPKDINLNTQPLIEVIEEFNQSLLQIACKPLQGRLLKQDGQLIFPFGSDAGLKTGGLAYVTTGSESWSLLEVSKIFPTSSVMAPINNLQNPAILANQTVRIIEGTIR